MILIFILKIFTLMLWQMSVYLPPIGGFTHFCPFPTGEDYLLPNLKFLFCHHSFLSTLGGRPPGSLYNFYDCWLRWNAAEPLENTHRPRLLTDMMGSDTLCTPDRHPIGMSFSIKDRTDIEDIPITIKINNLHKNIFSVFVRATCTITNTSPLFLTQHLYLPIFASIAAFCEALTPTLPSLATMPAARAASACFAGTWLNSAGLAACPSMLTAI